MSMFESEAASIYGLNDEIRSTIASGEQGNYASLYPEQGETLAQLLRDLAAAALDAPGNHGKNIDRAYAWACALRGEFSASGS